MSGINFAWMAVRHLSLDCHSRKTGVCDFSRHVSQAAAPRGMECGPCPDFASYSLAFAYNWGKSRKTSDPSPGGGRRIAGSSDSPELASSLALRLPASSPVDHWGTLAPHPDVVLRIPAGTTDFFLRRYKAILSSLRMAGESCRVETALIKAIIPALA